MKFKWRKWNRILHRDFGYVFFAMTIIYSLSGIALNHLDDWNPDYSITKKNVETDLRKQDEKFSREQVNAVLEKLDEADNYKKHYSPDKNTVKIFIDKGNVSVDLTTGVAMLIKTSKRPFFHEFNFLHRNNPKKLWTWFSDIFAGSLILLAITGLFMVRGRKGIKGRGAVLTILGIVLPIIFLMLYYY